MIEPTESEPKDELDRFCDALLSIRKEIQAVEKRFGGPEGQRPENAPHTMHEVTRDNWSHTYSRQEAAFPLPYGQRINSGHRSDGSTTPMVIATWFVLVRPWKRMKTW